MFEYVLYVLCFLCGVLVCSLVFFVKIRKIKQECEETRGECDLWAMQAGNYRKAAFNAINTLKLMEDKRDDVLSSIEFSNGEE